MAPFLYQRNYRAAIKKPARQNRNYNQMKLPISAIRRTNIAQRLAYIRNNPGEYADFNIPWSVNFNYALTFSKTFLFNEGFVKTISQNVNFGGTLNITPKWQTAVNGYYDITAGKINQISISISREMHCWQMSISLAPVGIYRSFSIKYQSEISPLA